MLDAGAVGIEANALETFSSNHELAEMLVERAVEQWDGQFGQPTYGHWDYYPFMPLASGGPRAAIEADFGANYQVSGVAEADVVTTDGDYIFIAQQQQLTIVDARDPEDLQIAAEVPLDQWANELYVAGDRLTVVSPELYFAYAEPAIFVNEPFIDFAAPFPHRPFDPPEPRVNVTVFDISDRSAPTQLSHVAIEGHHVDSRAVGDSVYLVTQSYFDLPAPEVFCSESDAHDNNETDPDGETDINVSGEAEFGFNALTIAPTWWQDGDGKPSCFYETEEEYVSRVAPIAADLALPNVTSLDADGDELDSVPLHDATDIYKPIGNGSNLISVSIIDVAAEAPTVVSSTGAIADYATTVYASPENVYLVSPEWSEAGSFTSVRQFSVDTELKEVDLAAIGDVPGTPLNQFSIDEHEGYLRIATTSGWGDDAVNHVTVLQQSEQSLEVVGQLDDLAPGERIFSARFMGDTAYVVTFRVIDPLFTIDLSDPEAPSVIGELSIPGFSNYLHPVDDGFLLGLGRGDEGFAANPQLSLFDTTDLSDPQRVDTFDLDEQGMSTPALWDHMAVGFYDEDNILTLPVSYTVKAPVPWIDLIPDCDFDVPIQCFGDALGIVQNGGFLDGIDLGNIDFDPTDLAGIDLGNIDFGGIDITNVNFDDFDLNQLDLGELGLADGDFDILPFIDLIDDPNVRRRAGDIAQRGRPHRYERVNELWVLQIDPDSTDEEISLLGQIAHESTVLRSVRIDDVLFSISADTVKAHPIGTPEEVLDELYFGPVAYSDHFVVDLFADSEELTVLENDRELTDAAEIVAVGETASGGEVTISDDGQTVLYTPPADATVHYDHFEYTVDTGDRTGTATVSIHLSRQTLRERMVDLAVQDLAERLDASEDTIDLRWVHDRVWPDSCLGVPSDGGCADVVTHGFQIALQHGGSTFIYHTDLDSQVILARSELHLADDFVEIRADGSQILDVLGNDRVGDGARIIEVSKSDLDAAIEIVEDGTLIRYTPSDAAIGRLHDSFTYTVESAAGIVGEAMVFVHIHPDDPIEDQAVPDEFTVEAGSGRVILDVLANDFADVRFIVPPTIDEVSEPSEGGEVAIVEDGLLLAYRPAEGFEGIETFTYSALGSRAEVAVHVVGEGQLETLIDIRLDVTNASGDAVNIVQPGDEFLLNVYVDDLRDDGAGVFATYLDIEYDPELAEATGEILAGEVYPNGRQGETSEPGLIDEVGAFSGTDELGGQERLLLSIVFVAQAEGDLAFFAAPADLSPEHDLLLYGLNDPIDTELARYGEVFVQVGGDWHNSDTPTDTDADGVTSPRDALVVINELNTNGSYELATAPARTLSASDGSTTAQFYLDVNGDGYVTPLDVLYIINAINRESMKDEVALAEGESSPVDSSATEPVTVIATSVSPRDTAGAVGPFAIPREITGPTATNHTSVITQIARDTAQHQSQPCVADDLFATLGDLDDETWLD